MKNADKDLLDGHFSGTLDDQQQKTFDQRLKTDPEFKELFDEYSDLHLGIDYSTLKTTKENLQVLEASLPEVKIDHQKTEKETPTISLKRKPYLWKIAAAVLVLAVSSVVLINYRQSQPEALYAKNFEPYPNEFVSVKRGEEPGTLKIQAFQAYDNQDYAAAIGGFNRILEHEEENEMVLFYLGNAQLANDEIENAITTLRRFLETSQEFTVQAKWYLALAYLKKEDIESSRKMLTEIQEDVDYGPEARTLLAKLN